MFSRSLFARPGFLRLSQVHSCSLSSLRLSRPARLAVPSYKNTRQSSAVPEFHEKRVDSPTPNPPVPSGTCFLANLPYNVTAEQLKEAFSEFGKIEHVKLRTTDAGLSRGVGFVQFQSVADAIRFVEGNHADPIFVLDRQLFVDHAKRGMNIPAEPSDTLVVLAIRGETDADVRTMFGSYADMILEVRINKKEQNPLGKAFVQFRNVNIATEAMDAFRDQNGSGQVAYAKHRQTPVKYNLTSRLSQHRDE